MPELITMPLSKIKPYEKNPRINEGSVQAVANSIKEFGFRNPIIVDVDGVIIAGHTRYKAALSLGLKTAPVIIAEDMTPEQVQAYRIADNAAGSASDWDYELLAEILEGLDYDMSQFGLEDGGTYLSDDFGDSFTLPEGDRESSRVMTFTVTAEQMEIIESTMATVTGEGYEMENTDEQGNKITEVCAKWLASRT